MVKFLAQSKKAIGGGVAAAVAVQAKLAEDGYDNIDYILTAVAFIAGFGFVWFTPKNAE